jgi:hypothetical protein
MQKTYTRGNKYWAVYTKKNVLMFDLLNTQLYIRFKYLLTKNYYQINAYYFFLKINK